MDIQLEGDLSSLTTETEGVCRDVLAKYGFNKCHVLVEAVGKKGDNYVANVKRLTAKQDGVNEGKEFKMIVKLAPNIQQVRDLMFTSVAFSNENVVYNKLFPKYDAIQAEANIPPEERLKHPICYGTYMEAPNEAVLLEDICESGFKLYDRFQSMSDEQARMVLNELAKIHALSFVLKSKDPEYYLKMKSELSNLWASTENSVEMQQFADNLERDALSVLENEVFKDKIRGVISKLPVYSLDLHKMDIDSEYSAIIQGDCWTNNMMFKHKDEIPIEVMMLDYQLTRIASPAADIFYFVFNCVDHDTRKINFNNWLDHYYACFEDFLCNFGLNANLLYPRRKLDHDLKVNSKNSIAIAVMLCNMLVRESEDVIDFKENPEAITSPDSFSVNEMRDVVAERFSKRLVGLIESCVQFGYL